MSTISRYNHFQPWRDGYYIAYNAMSGAVALMTDENYAVYHRIVEKLSSDPPAELTAEESELLKQLEYGRFMRADGIDERAALRMEHNLSRYDRTSLGLVIAPTMACNMACGYCFESKSPIKMAPAVIESVVSFVEKQAKTLGGLEVDWYGGEPLLALDIIEDLTESFLDLAEEHQFEYSSSIITNGYLLTPDNVDRLVRLKIRHAQVTLDGPGRMHNVKRPLKNGKESFDRIIENLKYAADKISIGVRVNVDKTFTLETIEELLNELIAAGLQERVGVYFGMVEPSSQVCANISESCYETADFSLVEVDYYRLLLQKGFRIDKLPSPMATFCMTQTVNAHLIDAEGYLYRCWNHVGDKEKRYGNIADAINYMDDNFQRLFAFNPFEQTECYECNLLPVCMGGCPARRTDRELPAEKMCEAWKHNLEPMLEIIALSRQQVAQQRAAQSEAETAAAKE